ncbi:baseplate J/gp47 family protein [Mesorhizobium sp.]|uniref:baseplate J/gp47 family protein n=1 Tax=Mesorhizobium sp. TaxID=1871066 RepID=UPI00121B6438|nr:baseplate J/gp47 family protein [Mesorhizobium sp.]TIS37504.1 MAG: baseplate J protein [Mesorhizobium sp.]
MALDFSTLAAPEIIETLDFDAVLDAMIADATARFSSAGVDYDVGNLETDPVKVVLEAAAYREVLLRARVNDAARANLLAFATGADLDHLAGFYDVARLASETDSALRSRTILAIQGRSPAGPEEHYSFVARSADVRVREVRVYRVDGGPSVRVALLASDNGGVPDSAMLAAVTAAVTAADVRVVSDVVDVVAATQTTSNIVASVWLLPDTPMSVFNGLEAVLRAAWAAEAGIGFDLNPSWIASRLHVAGVSRVMVSTPAAPVIVDDNHAIALGAITLTMAGRTR